MSAANRCWSDGRTVLSSETQDAVVQEADVSEPPIESE